MKAWGVLLVLALVGSAEAQSLTDLFLESERARLATLKTELRTLSAGEPSDDALGRMIELRLEIRRLEGRIRAIEEDRKRTPGPPEE